MGAHRRIASFAREREEKALRIVVVVLNETTTTRRISNWGNLPEGIHTGVRRGLNLPPEMSKTSKIKLKIPDLPKYK